MFYITLRNVRFYESMNQSKGFMDHSKGARNHYEGVRKLFKGFMNN